MSMEVFLKTIFFDVHPSILEASGHQRVKKADSEVDRGVGEGGKGVAEVSLISVCGRPAPLCPPWAEVGL